MRRCFLTLVLIVVGFFVTAGGLGAESPDLVILTQPTELASGELTVEADLGASGEPAQLWLDGRQACALTQSEPRCSVDLGENLHVHLLELIRRGNGGSVQSRAFRWLNKPGHEVDFGIELAARPLGATCGGRLTWSDHHLMSPGEINIRVEGERWETAADGRTFGYPCPVAGQSAVVAASALFPDGRCGAAATVADADGRPVADLVHSLALVDSESTAAAPCSRVAEVLGPMFRENLSAGFDVSFVLDPAADFRRLASLSGAASVDGDPWQMATSSMADADHLWFVTPNQGLVRTDGFSGGKGAWIGQLFSAGFSGAGGARWLADGVATAGRMVAADAGRRAVVLILGPNADTKEGGFSAAQARAYLAEIAVPLVIFRTGPTTDDGWPAGSAVSNLAELATALGNVRKHLDQQCVGWLAGAVEPNRVAALFPDGVSMAGHPQLASTTSAPVWRYAGGADDGGVTGATFSGEKVEVTAVTVLVTARTGRDRPVTDLKADDLEVREGGEIMPVLDLSPVHTTAVSHESDEAPEVTREAADGPPPEQAVPVAIYVDRQLSGSADIVPAVQALAEQSEWLCSLGPVDIVVAGKNIEVALEGARDVEVVRHALEYLAAVPEGGHAIERIRKRYLRELRKYPGSPVNSPGSDISGAAPDNRTRLLIMNGARSAIFEEDALLRRSAARVNDWALSKPADVPRVLFVVGAGFDEDPGDFYVPLIEQRERHLVAEARAEFIRNNQGPRFHELGRELAAAGWMVVPVAIRSAGMMTTAAEMSGGERFQAFLSAGFEEGAAVSDIQSLLVNPVGPQHRVAAPSGGEVAMGSSGLKKVVNRSAGWYRLTYQVTRAPDGGMHDLAVTTARDDVEIRTTRVVSAGASEGRAERRMRNLSSGSDDHGELPLVLAVSDPETIEDDMVRVGLTIWVDFEKIAPLFVDGVNRPIRFSVLVVPEGSMPFTEHRVEAAVGAVGGLQYELPLSWNGGPISIAVVAEDLGSGAWGGVIRRVELE